MGTYSKFNQAGIVIGALLICASTLAGDEWKYLTVVDPVPIRFQAAVMEYDPAKVLPPLEMGDEPAVKAEGAVVKPVEAAAAKPPQTTGTSDPVVPEIKAPQASTDLPVETSAVPAVGAAEPKADASQMTPQMLLRYFNQNGTREVVVPSAVEFTPPVPTTAASTGRSSAVYSSPPAK